MSSKVHITVSKIENDKARCGYCHESVLDEQRWTCHLCEAIQHTDCYQDSESCLSLGCKNREAPKSPEPQRAEVELVEGRVESFFQIFERAILGGFILFVSLFVFLIPVTSVVSMSIGLLTLDTPGFFWALALMAVIAFIGGISKFLFLQSWRIFGQAHRLYRLRAARFSRNRPTSPTPAAEVETTRPQIHIDLERERDGAAAALDEPTVSILAPLQFTYLGARSFVGFGFSVALAVLVIHFIVAAILEAVNMEQQDDVFIPLTIGLFASLMSALLSWIAFLESRKAKTRARSIYAAWRAVRNNGDSIQREDVDGELNSHSMIKGQNEGES